MNPKILFLVDYFGWAWDIKSRYLKKYLSKYYDIDIVSAHNKNIINWDNKTHDLYFCYGFSYIDFFHNIPKEKKITGVTAHRPNHMIKPAMQKAGFVHANSILLYNDLKKIHDNVFYVPNGVDTNLFYPNKDNNNLFYAPNGIDTDLFYPNKDNNSLTVGHVGKHSHLKGQDKYIIPAIKKSNCQSLIFLKNISNKIPHNKMPQLYNKMDIFLVASFEDGTPNPALEAAACGVPIISNYIGNMPELIKNGENGFLVNLKIDEYVDKIEQLKNNKELLYKMSINIRKEIEKNWTWEKQSKNYLKMFDKILNIKRN